MNIKALLHALRWPLVMVAASGLLLATMRHLRSVELQGIAMQEDELQLLQRRIAGRREAQRLVQRLETPYRQLERAGFLDADTSRTAWLRQTAEALRSARAFTASFVMKPPLSYREQGLEEAGRVVLDHPLEVDMKLAHEGDLVTFLLALLQHPAGVVENRYCLVSSIMKGDEVALDAPNLSVQCRFDWYALDRAPPGEGPGEGEAGMAHVALEEGP